MNYKFIGFNNEIEKNIRSARPFQEMFMHAVYSPDLRKEIISYLENGVFLTGVMSFIYDNDRKPIGNLDYYTDGKFIWPVYYTYYLKKYNNYYIEEDLMKHSERNNYIISKIDENELKVIERAFDAEWTGKYINR